MDRERLRCLRLRLPLAFPLGVDKSPRISMSESSERSSLSRLKDKI